MPYVSFNLLDADLPLSTGTGTTVSCNGDPVNPNYIPNLNLVINSNNHFRVYSTVNILEMVYNRVYLMQIKRGIDQIPQN